MTRTEFDAWMEEVSRAVVRLVDVLDAYPLVCKRLEH